MAACAVAADDDAGCGNVKGVEEVGVGGDGILQLGGEATVGITGETVLEAEDVAGGGVVEEAVGEVFARCYAAVAEDVGAAVEVEDDMLVLAGCRVVLV